MFKLWGLLEGRVYLANQHQSAELVIELARELCEMTGFALVTSEAGQVLMRRVHGDVCVYGGGPALSQFTRVPKAVVL